MEDQPEAISSSTSLDVEALRSRVSELSNIHTSFIDDDDVPHSDMLLKDCALHLQSRVDQILSEYSNVDGISDLDAYYEHLQGELELIEAENAKISTEIGVLNGTCVEDLNRLESDLEGLKHSLDFSASQDLEKAKGTARIDCSTYIRDHLNARNAPWEDKFEILKLSDQIEKNNITLNSLQDLNDIYQRFEAIEDIEDAMTGLKVLAFDKNFIRLSLTTHIPDLERLSCQHKIRDSTEPSELNHEVLIELMAGAMELKSVEGELTHCQIIELFKFLGALPFNFPQHRLNVLDINKILPNDVYIGEIIDAAKYFRQLFSQWSVLETRSSLGWFVRKVQDRIILCTLRKYMIKGVNASRHSFEYLDMDEMIVAHMVGGVSAFIKVSQGWPISNAALKLISLKSSNSKGISLSFLCKVEEVANSLDVRIRQSISSFVDAIEETLVQQMSLELHSNVIPRK